MTAPSNDVQVETALVNVCQRFSLSAQSCHGSFFFAVFNRACTRRLEAQTIQDSLCEQRFGETFP